MAIRALDLGEKSTFSGIFGRPQTLAWPIHAYRITIPYQDQSQRERINPFDRVIGDLLGVVNGMDEKRLAEETCLPIDLVRNVIFRLRDQGLIDEYNRIKDVQNISLRYYKCEVQYITALAFRELVGGKILPFVMLLEEVNPLKTKMVDEHSKHLSQINKDDYYKAPSPREIINAIGQMARRGAYTQQTSLPLEGQVKIVARPDKYLIECEIGVQTYDADFRIADPFGDGFSRILEGAFVQRLKEDTELQEWMSGWLTKLSAPTEEEQTRVQVSAPFDTPDNRRRFPKLINSLKPNKWKTYRSITSIYSSLEWALFYSSKFYDNDIIIRRLSLEPDSNYSHWMCDIAHVIGFERPPGGFRPVSKGKLERFIIASEADMDTVLTICLLQAQSNRDHPLYRVAQSQPDFLLRIRDIKKRRDESAHGVDSDLRSSDVLLESDKVMMEVVHALLPSICFNSGSSIVSPPSYADLRLEARTSLIQTLGYPMFSRLGPSAQETLLRVELFWCMSQEENDAREFVFNLYAVLQGIIRKYLAGVANQTISEDRYRELANERAVQAGLGGLPRELETVNLRRIRETMQGADHTLGASTLALLLKASADFLERLALSDSNFLNTIGEVLAVRGHGNEPVPMSKDAVSKLRRAAFASIEALLTNEG